MLNQLYTQFYEAMDNLSKSDSKEDKAKYTKEALELSEKIIELLK